MYIGTHIRGCCYEMAAEFEEYENAVTIKDGKSYLDIGRITANAAECLRQ